MPRSFCDSLKSMTRARFDCLISRLRNNAGGWQSKSPKSLTLAQLDERLRLLGVLKIIIREEAADDLDAAFAWVAKDDPSAAVELVR